MIGAYNLDITPSPFSRASFSPFKSERDFFNGTPEREKVRCANGRNLRINGEWRIKPNGKLSFRKFTKRHDYSIYMLVIDPDQIKL